MKYGAGPLLIFTCLLPDAAQAHAFEVPYVLPIPLWVYAYSCMAVLVVSFAALGYFFATPVAGTVPPSADGKPKWFSGTVGAPTRLVLRCGAFIALFLSIAAGLIKHTRSARERQYDAFLGRVSAWVRIFDCIHWRRVRDYQPVESDT